MKQETPVSSTNPSISGSDHNGASRLQFAGTRIIALAFITMNLATGLVYGSFGALVLPMVERFDSRVSVVSLGMSFVVMSSGLLALIIGAMINRFSLKAIMVVGAVFAAIGHAALAACTSIEAALACYGLLIGPGVAFLGFLPSYTLISRWYVQGQGRAFGIIGLPIVATIMPMVTTALLPSIGFQYVVLLIGAGYLLALPFVAMIINRPEDVGQTPYGQLSGSNQREEGEKISRLTLLQVARDPIFLLIALGSGLTVAPQTAKNVLLIPIVTERGFDVSSAAMLLSISAGTAMAGSLIFGTLADRIGPAASLMIAILLQAATWFILIVPANFALLIVDSVIMGACAGGFVAPKSVLVSRIYGSSNYALVMGMSGLFTLPLLFGMPPLMGLIRETTGTYMLAVLLQIGALFVAALCFLLVRGCRPYRARHIGDDACPVDISTKPVTGD